MLSKSLKAKMTPQQAAQILGVPMNVSEAKLKSVYRELVKKWHPDRNPNNIAEATEKIQLINVAYEVMFNYVSQNNNANSQQSQNTGHQQNRTSNRYSNPAVQEAWNKLQQALMQYEKAKSNYETAERDQDNAFKKWRTENNLLIKLPFGSVEYNKKEQYVNHLFDLYLAAQKHKIACIRKMLDAKDVAKRCEKRYLMLINAKANAFKAMYYSKQRAA